MQTAYSILSKPATASYVLAVLRDRHRQQCQYDPEAIAAELSIDTSVAEWREACDLVGWRPLSRALNDQWRVSISDDEWRRVLEPSASRNLAGVCELLASRALRPVVRPARFLGARCRTAGTFLAVRSLLQDAGADIRNLRPSTPLHPYTSRFPDTFLTSVSALAPGTLPLVRIHQPVYTVAVWLTPGGLAVAALAAYLDAEAVATLGILAGLAGSLLAWVASRFLRPARVQFGELRTFRDLAQVLTPPESQASASTRRA